jgi:cytoskeletal protein CcmA (bactofilin family)
MNLKERENMWNRDQAVLPDSNELAPLTPPSSATSTRRPVVAAPAPRDGQAVVSIGRSIVVKGELSGCEDLAVDGTVEGTIELRDNVLTIGPNGRVKAQVFAKIVIVLGTVNGNITASERIDIREEGSVDGNIVSPRVAIADGAHFRGSVDIQKNEPQELKGPARQEARKV